MDHNLIIISVASLALGLIVAFVFPKGEKKTERDGG